jgi:hypothetical protein
MKSVLNDIYISSYEYNYIVDLTSKEKFSYLIGRIETETRRNHEINLTEFFNEISTELPDENHLDEFDELQFGELNGNQVDVMLDNEHILIESNSLKNIKITTKNFFELGYILQRDRDTEKLFIKNKLTRFLRVYKITGNITPHSLS